MRMAGSLLALLMSAGVLEAQDPQKPTEQPPPRPMGTDAAMRAILQQMDVNKDGRIARDEARNRVAENFNAIDTNKDGYIDRTELALMARRIAGGPGSMRDRPRPGPSGFRPDPLDFDAYDRDADGRLTPAELRFTRFSSELPSIDQNKDGKIDPKEWRVYHARKP